MSRYRNDRVVIAGGSGDLGRRLADHFRAQGDEVTILTRRRRADLDHRQLEWDGRTVGEWASELDGAVLVNLAGKLVDLPPTKKNIAELRSSRVDSTRALVAASQQHAPALWLQMSTLAIYGDAGQGIVAEGHPVADGPPQMPGVAVPWEGALEGACAGRIVVMRTGIVLDHGTPAFDRLTRLTRRGLGGRISDGTQWISWLHSADLLRAVDFLRDVDIEGVVHITAPNPIQNAEMMRTLRHALHRPWSPPSPKPFVHIGAKFMHTDPALALTGRRCVPQRLLDAGFEFKFPTFAEAMADVIR